MDRALFFPEERPKGKPVWVSIIEGIIFIVVYLALICGTVSVVSMGLIWWNETLFIPKHSYDFALWQQYSNGKYHERICAGFKDPSDFQKEFCRKHNTITEYPKTFLNSPNSIP